MDNEKLVKSIKELCKKNNISISQLENELNFSPSLISRWKDKNPNIDRIIDIADYFHVSIDEVVGRINADNAFINKLIEKTQKKLIQWNSYDKSNSDPKFYYNKGNGKLLKESEVFYYAVHFHEVSYYSVFNNGYISIYGQYDDDKIANPNDIKLFIQPTKDSQLIEQNFPNKELYSLWVKVIHNVGVCSIDEIEAEEFKNDFINNKSEKTIESFTDEQLLQITQNMIEMEPDLTLVFEKLNDPEFSKFLITLESPRIQEGLKIAQRLRPYAQNLIEHEFGHMTIEHSDQNKK